MNYLSLHTVVLCILESYIFMKPSFISYYKITFLQTFPAVIETILGAILILYLIIFKMTSQI